MPLRAVAARDRADEPDGGLAVVRAAALVEQGRLLGERRVAVHPEELALDLGHRRGARNAVALLGEHLVVRVEVVQVVLRDRPQLVEHAPR